MWKPAHERHAIERVSASFQFDDLLPNRLWQSLLNKATVDIPRKGFNATNDELEFNLNLGPGGVSGGGLLPVPQSGPGIQIGVGGIVVGGGQPGNSAPAGRTFRVVAGNEVQEEVSLHRNRLVYATAIYDRWNVFKERMSSIIGSFLDQALPVASINMVKLEYWDRFVYSGAKENADFRQLLRQPSPYVPIFSSNMSDLWHSHVGLFGSPGSSQKRLLNLNVDVIDVMEMNAGQPSQERRSVGIYSVVQDTLGADKSPSNMAEAGSTLDEMHSILKEMLSGVITDEAAKQISLNGQGA